MFKLVKKTNKIKFINNRPQAEQNRLLKQKKILNRQKLSQLMVAFNYKMKLLKMDLILMNIKDYNIKRKKKLKGKLINIHKVVNYLIKMITQLKL